MVARQNLSQAVADKLLSGVTNGNFPVGSKLPAERDLCARFGVGRNTVREAVRSLAAQGVFDVSPGRGTTVLAFDGRRAIQQQGLQLLLTDAAIDDLYEFRMLIETEAAERAAERAGTAEREAVETALHRYEEAAAAGHEAYVRDVEFHAAVAHASMNSAYAAALSAVANTLTAVRRVTDDVPGAVEQACAEHRTIAQFIVERNPQGARAAMLVHIETARRTLALARETDVPTVAGGLAEAAPATVPFG